MAALNWGGPALVGALVAFLLNRAYDWHRNSDRARGLLRGILLEIDYAAECANEYNVVYASKKIWSPAYRLGTEFMRTGLPTLIELGALRAGEARIVFELYIACTEANRCLDQVAALIPEYEESLAKARRAARETSRTRGKFKSVSEKAPTARGAAQAALERMAWYEQQYDSGS